MKHQFHFKKQKGKTCQIKSGEIIQINTKKSKEKVKKIPRKISF